MAEKAQRRRTHAASSRVGAEAGHTVTTVRLTAEQWRWLREKALDRAVAEGGKPDASAIIRELVDEAITRSKR